MMDCHRFVLAPGAASEGAYRHEGEEFMHVLSGRLELVLDSDQFFDLGPGDSLYFDSRIGHAYISTSRQLAKTIGATTSESSLMRHAREGSPRRGR